MVYYPTRPRYFYYYNQYSRRYWGRYDRTTGQYSTLTPMYQRELLGDIAESHFPAPGPMPYIPESNNTVRMETPPLNVPPDESNTIAPAAAREWLQYPENKPLPRQVYSDWCKHGNYYQSTYVTQPAVNVPYTAHRVTYYPSRPRYLYYYNPVSRRYWGRYDLQEKGYSLLKQEDRLEKLEDIAESKFPPPAAMPPIPGVQDGLVMQRPTMRLPE